MLSCLFCKRKKRLFKIYVIYGETACPIKDYILEFFGPVEKHLNEDQGICKTCVFVLNNLLYIKNFMYQALISIAEDAFKVQQEIAFAGKFKLFRHNLKKVDYEKSKSGQSSPDLFTYARSPSNELVESNVQNADDDCEVQSNHSLLREGTPYADREVQRVLSKRKKRRSSERGVKTALSRSNSLASFHSEPVYKKRWSTDFSDFNSDISEDDRGTSKLRFNKDGKLLNKETRSVSRIISESVAAYAEYTERIYKCIDECMQEFPDLTSLTQHKIEVHKMLAKYWCYECYMTKFTSQEDLDKHNNLIHKILITNCPLCSEEMQNQVELQKHLAEHRIHSVPCNYCDKYFLNGQSCESHVREFHKGRRKRIKRRRPQTILDRIDKEITNEASTAKEQGVNETFVKILIQSVPAKEKQDTGTVSVETNIINNVEENSTFCNCNVESLKNQGTTDTVNVLFEVVKTTQKPEEENNIVDSCTSEERNNIVDSCTLDERNNIVGSCTLEERNSETGSACDVEEEICVTALEETFVTSVQEICLTYADNEVCLSQENEELPSNSNEEIENETREFTVEEEQVQSYDNVHVEHDEFENYISEICHEEIVTDNSEYLEVTSDCRDQFENAKFVIQQNKTNSNEVNVEDIQEDHSTIITTEILLDEFQKRNRERVLDDIALDNSDDLEVTEKNDEIDHSASATDQKEKKSLDMDEILPKKYPKENFEHQLMHIITITDQNKTNSQINIASKSTTSTLEEVPKKFHKRQRIRRKNLRKKTMIDSHNDKLPSTPDRPQLKIVLERLKIGNDFLQNLLVKSPIINNSTPSTSIVSKPNIVKPMKKKKLKKVTASVKTPIHYRKLTPTTSKIFREKKHDLTCKNLSPKTPTKHADDSLQDKLGIYDFKDEDDDSSQTKPNKNSLKQKASAVKSNILHKAKTKPSSSKSTTNLSIIKDGAVQSVKKKCNSVFPLVSVGTSVKTNTVESGDDNTNEKHKTNAKLKRDHVGNSLLR